MYYVQYVLRAVYPDVCINAATSSLNEPVTPNHSISTADLRPPT
jgi:hypothetical protein